jgi:mannose/fructose/N-acetylgalactosamine-specific phosphotransferase system component IIC
LIDWVGVLLIGGVIGLDATSFPQMMISRPLVAGTLVGLLFGEPAAGALIGGVIEVFHLPILPIGATRYPEAGTAKVAATVAYVMTVDEVLHGPALLLSLLAAFAWEHVGAMSANALRRRNERLAFGELDAAATARLVEYRHRLAIALDFARGAVVATVGAMAGVVFVRSVLAVWGAHPALAIGAITVAATAMLGSSLSVFGGWRDRYVLFLLGALCGALLLLVVR